MIYRMRYQMSDNEFSHFTNLTSGVYMKLPTSELNPQMLADVKQEDADLIVEVTITYVPKDKR